MTCMCEKVIEPFASFCHRCCCFEQDVTVDNIKSSFAMQNR